MMRYIICLSVFLINDVARPRSQSVISLCSLLHPFSSLSVLRALLDYFSLNFHACRHIGHCCVSTCEFSHLTMQCMWKQCVQAPQTSGQSSPGSEHSVQQLSKGIRQIPQLSSLAIQRHVATAIQSRRVREGGGGVVETTKNTRSVRHVLLYPGGAVKRTHVSQQPFSFRIQPNN